MIWLSIIPIGVALLALLVSINSPEDTRPKTKLKDEIRTESGYPKINLTVIQLDGVPQNVGVELSSSRDALIVRTNGFRKTISNKDIVDITVENANTIANSPRFSFGKAFVGTALLGGIGAVAGLHGKDKDLQMLVVSYVENNDVNYMVFLQRYGERRSVKAEQLLLSKIKDEMLDVVKGKYSIQN